MPTPSANESSSSESSDSGLLLNQSDHSNEPVEKQVTILDSTRRARYFERPSLGEKPIGFLRLAVIVLSSAVGVRPRIKREEDFRRANGLHVFIAAVVCFLLVVSALILLVNLIAS